VGVAGFPGFGRWVAGGALALAAAVGLSWAVVSGGDALPPADLRYVSGAEPETLDPSFATALIEMQLLGALFEGLVRLAPETLSPVAAAAEAMEVDAEGRTYTFRLREGLSWSDGSPLRAGDFLYAWRRAADPATGAPLQREAEAVARASRAPDERTIVIALERPRPSLPALLTLPCFLPLKRDVIEAHDRGWTRAGVLVSNGAFLLERWDPGRGLRLARNPHFHTPAHLASIDAVTIATAALGDATALRLYESGEVDLLFGVPAVALERLRDRPDLEQGPRLGTVFLRLNRARPPVAEGRAERPTPLADARVRRALALALDRGSMIDGALRGAVVETRVLVPDGLAGYVAPGGQREDADLARDLLAGARADGTVTGPLRFELMYNASDETARHAVEVLQARWREELGAEVRLMPMERKVYFQTMRRRDYDVTWGSWMADYPDPENFLGIFRAASGNNRAGFADDAYERLLDLAERTAEPAERLGVLARAEARLLDLAPCIPLYNTHRVWMRRPGLAGLVANPMHMVWWHAVRWESRR
jgi:oligopeptide transport system substrate-binding protein